MPLSFNEDIDIEDIVRDGQKLRVPMVAMDSLQRSVAAHAALNFGDAEQIAERREAARDAYIADLEQAWRSPQRVAADRESINIPNENIDFATADTADAQQARRDAAYRRYVADLENRWRGRGP